MALGTICLIEPNDLFVNIDRWTQDPHHSGVWWLRTTNIGFRITLKTRLRKLLIDTHATRVMAFDVNDKPIVDISRTPVAYT